MSGSIEKTISGFALPENIVEGVTKVVPDKANWISIDGSTGEIWWWAEMPYLDKDIDEYMPNNWVDGDQAVLGYISSPSLLFERQYVTSTGEEENVLTLRGESSNAPKVTYVKWIDAVHCDGEGWKELKEFEPVPADCYSVGFVVHEDDTILVLAATVDMNEGFFTHYCSEISIPKVCILERKEL